MHPEKHTLGQFQAQQPPEVATLMQPWTRTATPRSRRRAPSLSAWCTRCPWARLQLRQQLWQHSMLWPPRGWRLLRPSPPLMGWRMSRTAYRWARPLRPNSKMRSFRTQCLAWISAHTWETQTAPHWPFDWHLAAKYLKPAAPHSMHPLHPVCASATDPSTPNIPCR